MPRKKRNRAIAGGKDSPHKCTPTYHAEAPMYSGTTRASMYAGTDTQQHPNHETHKQLTRSIFLQNYVHPPPNTHKPGLSLAGVVEAGLGDAAGELAVLHREVDHVQALVLGAVAGLLPRDAVAGVCLRTHGPNKHERTMRCFFYSAVISYTYAYSLHTPVWGK